MRAVKPEARLLGIDDAPFDKFEDTRTSLIGCVFRGTTLEAVTRSAIDIDGEDATDAVLEISEATSTDHLGGVLLDGITFGGLNTVDIEAVADELQTPVIAVSREEPDLEAVRQALENTEHPEQHRQHVERAGKVHSTGIKGSTIYFQYTGTDRKTAEELLDVAAHTSCLPEALRVAHLIGAGVLPEGSP